MMDSGTGSRPAAPPPSSVAARAGAGKHNRSDSTAATRFAVLSGVPASAGVVAGAGPPSARRVRAAARPRRGRPGAGAGAPARRHRRSEGRDRARPRDGGGPRRQGRGGHLRRSPGAARRRGAARAGPAARSTPAPPPSAPGTTPPSRSPSATARFEEPLLRERAADVLDVGRRVVGALTGESGAGVDLGGHRDRRRADSGRRRSARPGRGLPGSPPRTGRQRPRRDPRPRARVCRRWSASAKAVLGIDEGTTVLLDGEAGTLQVDPPENILRDGIRAPRACGDAGARWRASGRTSSARPATARGSRCSRTWARWPRRRKRGRARRRGGRAAADRVPVPRPTPSCPARRSRPRRCARSPVALDGRPLVVRTLDAGADKPLPALPMPPEANPFLGVRGIRLTLERRDVLATQLRAILRVAAEHPVKVMLPMVATLDEIRAARGSPRSRPRRHRDRRAARVRDHGRDSRRLR